MQKPLAFKRRIYASFRTILVLGIFWRLPLLFLDIKIKFIEFTSSRPFLMQCVILFKQKSRDRSSIFLTVLASLKGEA